MKLLTLLAAFGWICSQASAAPHLGESSTGSYTGQKLSVNGKPYPSKHIEIPFENPAKLTEALKAKATLSARTLKDEILYRTSDMATNGEQMPPTKRLSPQDRQTLADYLDSLNP